MNNSVYYKATDEDGNIILRHGWKQNLEDGAARKRNQQAREDYVRANRLKKVRKVIKEVKRLTKPGTPYKGPTSAHHEQQIQKDKERQKLAKELKNQQAREDYVRANRLKKVRKVVGEVKRLAKPGTPYKGPTSAHQAQQIQKDKERQKLAKELKNRKIAEQNRRAREDYVRANRLKKVRKVVGEVNKLTKPGTPYKGPTSAFQAQQIQKDKERQKLAKELKNRKIAEHNRRAREKAANINRRKKAGKAYLNNLTK